MPFSAPYNKQEFLAFCENQFLPGDFEQTERRIHLFYKPNKIKRALELGKVPSLGRFPASPLRVYEIEHESENDPRVTLTREAFSLLQHESVTRALIVFYNKTSPNYRFSLMRVDYAPRGKRVEARYSNPRRYSFFLGPDSKIHTPNQFLIHKGKVRDWEDLMGRFSIEAVTKEFYKEIANWYFLAVNNCVFPKDAKTQENGRQMAVIRLITRLVFIWFMRERGLIPRALFEKEKIAEIVKDVSANSATYYKAILQNLFFATLSTKKEERTFSSEARGIKGGNPDFGNQYVYRYHELFNKPGNIKEYFGEIPFLNGGLFECLDEGRKNIYIDGFTRRKKFQPHIPNNLFFSEETEADLNSAYGTINKRYKVRGLIDILSSYNFTIDENNPNDADIALDPELLGKVFENLLANFNPETGATARKATGSYYTPREIVDYMVTQSLKEYFKTHLLDTQHGETEKQKSDIDKKLNLLFEANHSENPFGADDTKTIVKLVDNLKIADPAVGSGAFPMGILNKLVFLLSKLDAENALWKEAQLTAARAIPDIKFRQDAIASIEKNFSDKNATYGRKLYLIQKCIYGVDIQPIAVEIAKLRFFISLLVDENIDKTKDNCGIEPLPNLDFKIMQGNSLVELLSSNSLYSSVDQARTDLVNKIKNLKDELFGTSSPQDKKIIKQKIDQLMNELSEYGRNTQIQKIEERIWSIKHQGNLFEDEMSKKEDAVKIQKFRLEIQALKEFKIPAPDKHFEWHINFSEVFQEKNGFDIVIANPPYVQIKQIPWNDRKAYEKFKSAVGRFNIFYFFLELSGRLTKPSGVSSFIVPDRLLLNTQCSELRKWLLKEQSILEIDSFMEGVFDAVVDSIIIIYQNKRSDGEDIKVKNKAPINSLRQTIAAKIPLTYFLSSPSNQFDLSYKPSTAKLLEKVKSKSIPLGDISDIKDGIIQGKVADKLFLDKPLDDDSKPLLFGEDVTRYAIRFNNKWVNYKPSEMMRIEIKRRGEGIRYGLWMRTPEIFERPKILTRQTADEIIASYDAEKNYYYSNTLHGTTITDNNYAPLFVLGILNSNLMTWYYRSTTAEEGKVFAQVKIALLRLLPIIQTTPNEQKPFIALVNKILAITDGEDYLQNPAKQSQVREHQRQIDDLVYELYGLSEEERKVVKLET